MKSACPLASPSVEGLVQVRLFDFVTKAVCPKKAAFRQFYPILLMKEIFRPLDFTKKKNGILCGKAHFIFFFSVYDEK